MTQKEQYQKLAAAIVAEYQKESAAPAALVQKYEAILGQAKEAAKAARAAWDNAEEEARHERAALLDQKTPEAYEKAHEMLKEWRDIQEPPLVDAYTTAGAQLKRAEMLANLAALPLLSLRAVAILKLYAAFFEALPKVGTLNRSGSRREIIQEYIKQIDPKFFYWGSLKLYGAEVRADPYSYEGNTTKEKAVEALQSAEQRHERCLKSEADILNRVGLILQAQKQMQAFKTTYEKSGRALRQLMQGLFAVDETMDTLKNISFY